MSQADLFAIARVRVNGKCAIVDLRTEPMSREQRQVPFPQTPICEWTGQPYHRWCRTHRRYHQDHHEAWTEICEL
jgi:phospholipase C